jgi:hypothetical protein
MKMSFFSLIASLAFVTVANAVPMQTLSFDDLRAACREPKRFQNQIQPTSIVLDCSDRVVRWVPSAEGTFSLPSKRVITHAVGSDKYRVSVTGVEVSFEPAVHACPTMKQIEETVALSQEVTCDQLANYEGTATKMCQQLIEDLRAHNPAAITLKDTGKTLSFCNVEQGGTSGGGNTGTPMKKKPMTMK